MVHRRKSDIVSVGERAENKARADAKKPITAETPSVDGPVTYTGEQRRRASIAVAARAHGPDDCRWLLDALGLGEAG